ncbi:hypothetical protein J6590_007035 [Homalodisca vitripennis]|nr:hypothetical protein J6590_007035 [Homalodisca vitripennis]
MAWKDKHCNSLELIQRQGWQRPRINGMEVDPSWQSEREPFNVDESRDRRWGRRGTRQDAAISLSIRYALAKPDR